MSTAAQQKMTPGSSAPTLGLGINPTGMVSEPARSKSRQSRLTRRGGRYRCNLTTQKRASVPFESGMHRPLVQFLRAATLRRIHVLLHSLGAQIFSIVGSAVPVIGWPDARGPCAGWVGYRVHSERPSQLCHAGIRPQSCNYCLYVPSGLTATDACPCSSCLHGCRQDGQTLATGTRMNTLADRHRFIVLYPEQSLRANPLRWLALV